MHRNKNMFLFTARFFTFLTFLKNFYITFFNLKTLKKWHTYIIKQQITETFSFVMQ